MINLIHPETKEKRLLNKKFSKLAVFFIAIALLALSTWGTLYFAREQLNQKMSELETQISTVNAKVLKFRELEKKLNLTNNRLDQVLALTNSRQSWSKNIMALANDTPSNIKINSLSVSQVTDKSGGYQFVIAATAKTLDDIEVFRKTLDESGSFTGSTFQTATYSPDTGTFTFNMISKLK
jgi:Tfp pilus assembly protein PilN